MVKTYLKFEHSKTFGLITSASSNAVWTRDAEDFGASTARQTGAGRAIVGANEEVLVWDVKKGELLGRWKDADCKARVTVITKSQTDEEVFAVGYDDGSIRVWDSRLATIIISFNGHKSAITTLAFDDSGVRLASGSKDTDIVVWDLVAEVGLYKLRGHKDQVTSLHFLRVPAGEDDIDEIDEQGGCLLTTGKDSLIKIWDLSSQHCIETHIAQSNGECWALGISPDQSGCITAGNDGELRVWSIDARALRELVKERSESEDTKVLRMKGALYRQGKDRPLGIHWHPKYDYVAIHGSDKSIEIWRVRSETEIQKSLARKRKRRREKAAEKGVEGNELDEAIDVSKADISEVFVSHLIIRTGGKMQSVDWAGKSSTKALSILAATTNNQLEVYNFATAEKKKAQDEDETDYSRTLSVDMPGHRTDIRALALSSDDRMVASASNGSLKIWNVRTQTCLRTLECGYALCCAFLPGDKIVVVGNKDGNLEMFDIASSTLLETVQAHDGPLWTMQVHPSGKSLVTGSADKSAKFWDFKVVQEEVLGSRQTVPKLKLVHTRTLKVADDILNIRISPDSKLIAAALLDNTVKVFFTDSLKLFLNLYGHKLPVLNMDISYDSKLIVTCSADKNVRVWGLDFGDCHKAFFAHQDSIMAVNFIPNNNEGNGHNFFSASKDRVIKYYDGDKFEQIQKLEGHHGEIWALTVSHSGEFVVSASHDKSIRIWQQTDEQIFLEEEREKELEELYENTLTTSLDADDDGPDGEKAEAVAAGKQTVGTLMAGEKIMEALEHGMEDLELMREYYVTKRTNPNAVPPPRNPIFLANGNISAERYVLKTVQKIPAAALQDALLVLPFAQIPPLFTFLNIWALREWDVPLTCRILFFMLKTHHKQIIATKLMRPMLEDVRGSLRKVLGQQKEQFGYNLAAVQFLGERVKEKSTKDFIDEEKWEEEQVNGGSKGKKRGFVNVA